MFKSIADALVAFGPLGVFCIGFIDSLGIPLPAALDALLLTIAIQSPQLAYLAAALAVVGSLGGNYFLFRAARYGGSRLVKEKDVEPMPAGRREKFRRWFARYGLLTVFIPAVVPFVPLPLKVFVISAGAMRTPASRFLGVIFLARVIRYFGQAWIAIRLGQDAHGFLAHNAWNMVAALLAMSLALIAVVKWYDRRRVTAPLP